jgi:hypothetical protein
MKMTTASAREAIIRKFTNYRKLNLKGESPGQTTEAAAMTLAANALADLRSYSKGQSVFKIRKHDDIRARRDEILRSDPSLAQIGAYSKAVKQLWAEEEDHGFWEAQALEIGNDVYL